MLESIEPPDLDLETLAPGISENQLFSDGDWVDGHMLCSGPRKIPEASTYPL